MKLGYVTNGFAHHRLDDAINILADIGFQSVAITLDEHHLNPFADSILDDAERIRELLDDRGMVRTVETGARFLLNPRRKHFPTLVSANATDRRKRIDFLLAAIDVAAAIGANVVSLWSGATDDDATYDVALDRLVGSLTDVVTHADRRNIRIGFEPEPGMLIETMAQFGDLVDRVDADGFGLTLDIGHVHCLSDGDLFDHLRGWQNLLYNIHLEDMRRGVHDHLFFGEGEIRFAEVMHMLTAIDYAGPVHVELSRHSHNAPEVARRAYEFLTDLSPTPP